RFQVSLRRRKSASSFDTLWAAAVVQSNVGRALPARSGVPQAASAVDLQPVWTGQTAPRGGQKRGGWNVRSSSEFCPIADVPHLSVVWSRVRFWSLGYGDQARANSAVWGASFGGGHSWVRFDGVLRGDQQERRNQRAQGIRHLAR